MRDSRQSVHYPGEDNKPTSAKELRGWFAYSVAAEVFAVCGVGSFLPITLEQLARERGVLKSDGVTPCVESSSELARRDNAACVVQIFGSSVNTSSFALYTFSVSVLVQALVLISISAIADHGGNRKKLLLVLSYTGASACMMFLIVVPKIYFIGSFLVIISVSCLGNSFVLLNSFLPLLVANHPAVNSSDVAMTRLNPSITDEDEPDSSLLETEDPLESTYSTSMLSHGPSPAAKLSNQISSKGVGIGYAAAGFVQLISIAILVAFSKVSPSSSKTTLPMRVVLFMVGLWWAVFTIPTALWLRRRPGPPLPSSVAYQRNHRLLSWLPYVKFAWVSLWKTVKAAAKLRQVVLFLCAWFLLSDAVATVSGAAILFAKTELQMGTEALAGLSIVATSSGIVGAIVWPIINRKFNLDSKHIIILCIFLFEVIPVYGLLGFLPFVKAWGVGGLQQQWEIFPLGFILGLVMGGLSSYCRSVFGRMIPPQMEAAFYALYAVTDKGSSVIGPAIVGRIVDTTGSIRTAFWFLAVLIILPAPLIWLVNIEKGHQDALQMSGRRRNSVPTAVNRFSAEESFSHDYTEVSTAER